MIDDAYTTEVACPGCGEPTVMRIEPGARWGDPDTASVVEPGCTCAEEIGAERWRLIMEDEALEAEAPALTDDTERWC